MNTSVQFETMVWFKLLLVTLVAVASGLPMDDPVLHKLDPEQFHIVSDADGCMRSADLWLKASDFQLSARYNPDSQNVYHIFTRRNPSTSQPVLFGNQAALTASNFSAQRRTAILIHGWMNSATSDIFTVLVPAFLAAEDMNVIVVDWSAGAMTVNYGAAVTNTVTSGQSVARFLNWVSSVTGVRPASFHIAGHSLGGHQAGIVGRNLNGQAAYITSLDPALLGWITNNNRFHENDGAYTEVIHTNAGRAGYITPLGHVDFYPNGGIDMPGCDSDNCDHGRAYYYFAESLISGGFMGTRCASYASALLGNCGLPNGLNMGGITPKTGQRGIFHLVTNASPPFSR